MAVEYVLLYPAFNFLNTLVLFLLQVYCLYPSIPSSGDYSSDLQKLLIDIRSVVRYSCDLLIDK